MPPRRKRKNKDLDDFVIDSDNEEELLLQLDNILQQSRSKKTKHQQLVDKYTVTVEMINKLKASDEVKMWFYEHIMILSYMPVYFEERYNLRMRIYNKYQEALKAEIYHDDIKKLEGENRTNKNWLEKIIKSNHSDHIKMMCYKKYKTLCDTQHADYEKLKITEWLDCVLNIPTEVKNINENYSSQLVKIKNNLDKNLYGLKKVKENVLEIYCSMLNNSKYKNKFIGLVGPPGVGKTAISSIIAKSLNLPFKHISLGGIKDASVLIGHSSTYVGSKPGLLVNTLNEMKYLNGVILLDEIDKVGSDFNDKKSISSVLIHLLDKSQNKSFQDSFMPEVPIDMSNVLFIVSMNDVNKIDKILKDRLNLIYLDGYNEVEKSRIVLDYIIPKTMKDINLTNEEVSFDRNAVFYLVKKFSNKEKGVRELERQVAKILERINLLKYVHQIEDQEKIPKMSYSIKNFKLPIEVTMDVVKQLLE